jgi:hypothetical protein
VALDRRLDSTSAPQRESLARFGLINRCPSVCEDQRLLDELGYVQLPSTFAKAPRLLWAPRTGN